MAALDAALAFAERHHAAPVVGENLDFDVPRPLQIFLDVHRAVPKRLLRFPARRLKGAFDFTIIGDDAHAFPAAARRRFEQDGIAEPLGFGARFEVIAQRRRRARDHRHACGLHPAACLGLVPHRLDRRSRRSDEDEPGVLAYLSKRRPLREKAVPWVHRLAARVPGRRDQLRDVEIGVRRRRGADGDRGIGVADVRSQAVSFGINRDRRETFFVAGTDDANRDFAAVRDQHPFDHRSMIRSCRGAACCAPTNTRVTCILPQIPIRTSRMPCRVPRRL